MAFSSNGQQELTAGAPLVGAGLSPRIHHPLKKPLTGFPKMSWDLGSQRGLTMLLLLIKSTSRIVGAPSKTYHLTGIAMMDIVCPVTLNAILHVAMVINHTSASISVQMGNGMIVMMVSPTANFHFALKKSRQLI
mmetsp:Transcript_42356/g.88952  ORF Transcript_42356/g.88952 Transcript_42356/m.88952 type:complete len:135 (-) Transcript_42356:110-514(-)